MGYENCQTFQLSSVGGGARDQSRFDAVTAAAEAAAAEAAASAAAAAGLELRPSLNCMLKSINYELCMKHPLEHTWTLWHWENDRRKAWSDMLVDVTSFNTVEDFFGVYNFIKPPSDLKVFNDYLVFKRGIRPMWEDDINKNGGRWVMIFDRNQKELVDKLWHDLLLSTIGECFEYSNQICGVVINVRNKATKISLWTKDAAQKLAVMTIGQQMKQLLQLGDIELQYQMHRDAMVQSGPNVNAIYKLSSPQQMEGMQEQQQQHQHHDQQIELEQ